MWLGRAHLARMTPSSANGGAAQRLGAHNTTQLTLAHLVADLCEARAGSVVSFTLWTSKSINTRTSVWSNATPTILTPILTNRLSTVSPCISLQTCAGIFITGASVHTSDTTGLNCSSCSSTAGSEVTTGAGAQVRPRAEAIATRVPANWNYTLVSPRQRFPSRAAVRLESRTTYIGPPEGILSSPAHPLLDLPLWLSVKEARLQASVSLSLHRLERRPAHGSPSQHHPCYSPSPHQPTPCCSPSPHS